MANTIYKNEKVQCPDCKQWYARYAMVVINHGQENQTEVCIDCYEENHFVPPAPLKKGV